MKRRVIALAISFVLLLGILPSTTFAAFIDLVPNGEYKWAYDFIDDMTSRGFYQGHPDGTFRPGDLLTLEQAYALAVRLCGFSGALKAEVTEAYADTLDDIFDDDRGYFRAEFAIAIELGIVTPEQLAEQYESGELWGSLTREEFSRILVIAMQLLPPVTGWKLEFGDAADIDRRYAGYVYTLSSLRIVIGDTNDNFKPKDTIRRADSATMLSRAVDYMEQNGIEIELFDYTDYTAVSGSIAAVVPETDGSYTLTLTRDYQPDIEVFIPTAAKVYEHNILTAKSDMETGRFCHVLSDKTRGVFAVRLYSAPMRYTGSVRDYNSAYITVDTGTAARDFHIDRLTVVTQVGGLEGAIMVGGRDDISYSAGYVTAECTVDETGRLVGLHLIGGKRNEIVIFRKLENGIAYVDSFSGTSYELPLSEGASIQLDGAAAAANTGYAAHSGRSAWLELSNTSGKVTLLDIDTKTTYIQGGLVRVTTRSSANSVISVSDPDTGREDGYVVTSNVKAFFNGKPVALTSLEKGSFVTLRLDSGNAAEVLAYAGTYTIEGGLTKITFGTVITLDITREDGSTEQVKLNPSALPPIARAGKTSSIDKLMSGDAIVVTVTYNRIASIESLPPTADVSAVVKLLMVAENGTFLTVALEDGTEEVYSIADGASITQNGKSATMSQIKVGTKVALALSGTQVSAIEIEGQSVTSGELSGTVKYINTADRTILLDVGGEIRTVSVPITANVVNSKGQNAHNALVIDAAVQVFGEYNAAGNFVATLVVVK